ncbi:MAG: DUF3291 domain-containing protein [Flavobacteriaceae bacterium]|nr:DUF3291 domain-containing protein [Flavobacteriaceae bacterium]
MSLKLAQLNLAKMTLPVDHPDMSDFVNNLDRINALADQSAGFVWRYTEEDNTASKAVFGPDMLVNMSVWERIEDLTNFTYKSPHLAIYKRRKEWFAKMDGPHMVCWYVEEGHIPSLEEAKERIAYLEVHGETPYAFSFRKPFSRQEARSYHS